MLKQRVILIVFVCLTIIGLAACGTPDAGNGTAGSANPTATAAPSPTSVPTQASTAPSTSSQPFQVTSIDMAVTPMSIAGMTCGQNITVTYTATFHVAANSPGGTVQFLYTVNNGRGTTPASLSFAPGETTKTYSFNWQGTLAADNVYPGLGGVVTSSPNVLHSPSVKPTGTCVSPSAAFKVTSIDLAVSPSSIAGMSCNSSVTFTYTVTFHVAPNSSGGTIQFMYTTTNGRGSTNASVTASPGATTVTYKFTSSGVLSSDHTFPDIAEVISSSPDQVNSSQVKPAGQCS
ncbi:MAG TPA: hypothetical protein VKV40_02610 [Ktedonobacteraceae bacterium]|nr:hypothetical protein [Ktedonobacteraceae bacterium]